MKFLYTNEKGGKIGHVTAYGPIAAVKIAKILKICCTVGCALIVLQHLVVSEMTVPKWDFQEWKGLKKQDKLG